MRWRCFVALFNVYGPASRSVRSVRMGGLPDHMHGVWTIPPNDANFALRWRLIKLLFARALPATERRSTVRPRRGKRGIWQRRYWEHCIRDVRDFRHHIDYLHWNPLKHGHVTRVQDWPCSSFHRLVRLRMVIRTESATLTEH